MRRRRDGTRGNLAVGFLLLSWGGIMLITNVESERWPLAVWWPSMIISLGIFFLITPGHKYGWSVVSLVSGGLALAANHGKITLDTVFVWWPSILVGIGVWIIFRAIVPEKSTVTGKRRPSNILDRTADQFSTKVSEPQMTGVSASERANAEGSNSARYSSRTEAGRPRTESTPVQAAAVPVVPVVRGHTPARRTTTGLDVPQAVPPPPSYQPASRYEEQLWQADVAQPPEYTSVGRYLSAAQPQGHYPHYDQQPPPWAGTVNR